MNKEQNNTNILAAGAKLPICIVHGVDDKHLSVQKMRQFARVEFEHAEFHAVDEAGHMCFYERPEKTNRVILDFMLRISA